MRFVDRQKHLEEALLLQLVDLLGALQVECGRNLVKGGRRDQRLGASLPAGFDGHVFQALKHFALGMFFQAGDIHEVLEDAVLGLGAVHDRLALCAPAPGSFR